MNGVYRTLLSSFRVLLINKKYSHINIKEVRQIIYELLLKPTTMVCGLVVLGDA